MSSCFKALWVRLWCHCQILAPALKLKVWWIEAINLHVGSHCWTASTMTRSRWGCGGRSWTNLGTCDTPMGLYANLSQSWNWQRINSVFVLESDLGLLERENKIKRQHSTISRIWNQVQIFEPRLKFQNRTQFIRSEIDLVHTKVWPCSKNLGYCPWDFRCW